jgi:hypothetical protein
MEDTLIRTSHVHSVYNQQLRNSFIHFSVQVSVAGSSSFLVTHQMLQSLLKQLVPLLLP